MQPMPCATAVSTPNHRWAIASVRMLCAKLFDKPECRTAAEAILKEGNDCNEGRRVRRTLGGNYNRINNDAMIMLAVATGDELLCAGAAQPGNDADLHRPRRQHFTNNSTRWDMGKKIYPRGIILNTSTWAIPAASLNCWTQPTPLCRWWSAMPCAATASST